MNISFLKISIKQLKTKKLIFTIQLFIYLSLIYHSKQRDKKRAEQNAPLYINYQEIDYEKLLNTTLIFIGGFPNSGSYLIKDILDTHPMVSCQNEIKIIPKILETLNKFQGEAVSMRNFADAGFKNATLRSAIGLFIYNYMKAETSPAKMPKYLCSSDDDILSYVYLIHNLFPNAKFLFMIKDGRQTAFSMLEGKEKNLTRPLFRSYIRKWFSTNFYFKSQCNSVGEQFCRLFRYEDLIGDTKRTLKSIYAYLNLGLSSERFVYHDIYIGNRVDLDRSEKLSLDSAENLFRGLKSYDRISFTRVSKFLEMHNYII